MTVVRLVPSLVIPVASFSCHPSSLFFLSSQCLTLGSRRLNSNQVVA
ncbi:hypothetical protein [Wolbachia endosymbiont (group A) of Anomoia purmunda]|nr:hypothetical protein [Wolbachia endosymbiont (group A) of Anomoia purmunda]